MPMSPRWLEWPDRREEMPPPGAVPDPSIRLLPPVRSPRNLFTADLEEWFHVCGAGPALDSRHWDGLPSRVEATTGVLLDMLDRAGVHATFFVLGWVAERHPRLVERVRAAGHAIGSHGYAHERAYDLGPERFRADLRRSVATLMARCAPVSLMLTAPVWSCVITS